MAIAVLGPNISFDPGGWSVLMAISFHQAHRSFSLQEGAAVSAGMRTMKIMQNEFHRKVQEFLANAFTSSMIRNMVQPGSLKRIQDFLKQKIDLTKISKLKPEQYPQTLDQLTEELMQALPPGDRKWGVARKCLNLFFRDALYNFYLREAYSLAKFEKYMEIPLDKSVGHGLKDADEGTHLPSWDTVKGLTRELSNKFQAVAAEVSKREKIARVHLDLDYWRKPVK